MLMEKQSITTDKIIKPDFSKKTGREFLAFYLQTKFKQILQRDKKAETPQNPLINQEKSLAIPAFSCYYKNLWL